jgi:hypothetical protein
MPAGASTVGVNSFPQMGLLFSVGTGCGKAPGVAFDVVVVDGDWAVDGVFELQLTIDTANAPPTAAPTTARVRRTGSNFSI